MMKFSVSRAAEIVGLIEISTIIVMGITALIAEKITGWKRSGQDDMIFIYNINVSHLPFPKKAYTKWGLFFFHPLLLTTVLLIILISVTHVSADQYLVDSKWLTHLLGPATVAFAVPIYKNLSIIKKYIGTIIIISPQERSSPFFQHLDCRNCST